MPARERPVDRATRRALELNRRIGRELRDARHAAGLSQDAIGAAVGLSGAEVGRIERAEAPWLTVMHASRVLSAVGLGLWAKTFPAGPPLRDAGHGKLLSRFEQRLPPQVAGTREWPVPGEPPGRALDLLLTGLGVRIGVEAETVITDEQSLTRELMSKKADARLDRVILLVSGSQRNREAIGAADGLRRALPLGTRAVLAALGRGRDPGADGIVVL